MKKLECLLCHAKTLAVRDKNVSKQPLAAETKMTDSYLPWREAFELAYGQVPSSPTFWRYCNLVSGPRLRTVIVCGQRRCRVSDVVAFIEARSSRENETVTQPAKRSATKRAKAIERAERDLEKALS